MQKKPLFILFLTVLLLFLALLGAGRWWVGRAFPQVSGTLELDGLQGEVEIRRDGLGVPHIYASSLHDVYFAQGVVHAQDRLWQMDLHRRVGKGELSELLGESTVEVDQFFRTIGTHLAAKQDLEAMLPRNYPIEARAALEAYSKGVNAYMATEPVLPLEYQILEAEWEPWTPLDTVAWSKVMQWNLNGNWEEELLRARLIQQIGAEESALLLGDHTVVGTNMTHTALTPQPPLPIIGRPEASKAEGENGGLAPPSPITSSSKMVGMPKASKAERGFGGVERAGMPVRARSAVRVFPFSGFSALLEPMGAYLSNSAGDGGSNAWVVSAELSQTGRPILANDPHLGIGMPNLWYEIGLHTPQMDVIGVSFPGAPAVIIGHNQHLAWGITNLATDTQDLFIERLNDAQDAYQWQDESGQIKMKPLTIREERIQVKDGADIVFEVKETHHGPLLNEVVEGLQEPMALQWQARQAPVHLVESIFGINFAQNRAEFVAALRLWDAPAQNILYADDSGQIGAIATGALPIRQAEGGLLPMPGWTGEWEWQGVVPFEQLPQVWNPANGRLVNANQYPFPADFPYYAGTKWAEPSRFERIEALLNEQNSFTLDEMQAIQRDVLSLPAQKIVPLLIQLESDDIIVQRAQEQLAEWNHQMDGELPGAAIYAVTRTFVLQELLTDEFGQDDAGRELFEQYLDLYYDHTVFLLNLLEQPNHPLWDDTRTPEEEERDEILLRALEQMSDWLGRRFGDVPHEWFWKRLHTATFDHPLGSVQPLDRIFNYTTEANGSGSTVNVGRYSFNHDYQAVHIATYRQLIDVGGWQNARMSHATGQSGQPFHAHYNDMVDTWREVELAPMWWSDEQTRAASEGRVLRLEKRSH